QTDVTFDGEVKISGMLATMGQRVIGGVANTLTKQFFNNLEKELANRQPVKGR
ncbi:MAG: carbon monoxide dehydrogenase subunit, partial [Segetibacter sp.]|nr:carbon monoxide dehydrogenase subunit [Segetibacter sp.]